jgi:hypothetical protein
MTIGADYFAFDYPEAHVEGLTIGEDGIDRDGPAVTRLLAWVARKAGRSPDTRYAMSRHDAAVLLELVAGWPYGWRHPPAQRLTTRSAVGGPGLSPRGSRSG